MAEVLANHSMSLSQKTMGDRKPNKVTL